MVVWQQQSGAAAPGVICVNMSSRQFVDADLAGEVESTLSETGLAASA